MTSVDLPIEPLREPFLAAVSKGRVVVSAPTGSGKSTRIPVWLTEAGSRTLVVEPRRIACRSLAVWLSRQAGSHVGGAVGYAYRHEKRYGPATRLVFSTPGTALRMLQQDLVSGREVLADWDAIVLDEFHERQLEVDLLLGLLLAQNRRFVVMSATLDADRVKKHIDGEHLDGQGRLFPVDVEYMPTGLSQTVPVEEGLAERIVGAVQKAQRHGGDILVFLPGKGEIAQCQSALKPLAGQHDLELIPLHGGLTPAQQDRAFRADGRRRVVLATNVAETSVTLPRVGVVIDGGLVRQTRYHWGESILATGPVSAASAEQRRGRAGRTGPGVCFRLWAESAKLRPADQPEMLRHKLADPVLRTAKMGFSLDTLPLLDPPPDYAIEAAEHELVQLGCLAVHTTEPSGGQHITERGSRATQLPASISNAALLAAVEARVRAGAEPALLHDVVDLVASSGPGRRLLLPPGPDPSPERRLWHEQHCDAVARILALREGVAARDAMNPWVLDEARRIAVQLRASVVPKLGPAQGRPDRQKLVRSLALANPNAVYGKRKRKDAFGNVGSEVRLARESLVNGWPGPNLPPAIVVFETIRIQESRGRIVTLATCAIPAELALLKGTRVGRKTRTGLTIKRGVLRCGYAQTLADQKLNTWEEVPTGPDAQDALVAALSAGRVFRRSFAETASRMALWNVYRKVERLESPALDLEPWIRARIDALGFESGADLPLLSEDDVLLDWPAPLNDPALREQFSRNFPLEVRLGNDAYDIEYDANKRSVTMVSRAGTRGKLPSQNLLPSWAGWRVFVKRGSAVSLIRGR